MTATAVDAKAARSPRLVRAGLIVLLAAVAAIPLAALWGAFGPYAHRAADFTLVDQDGRPFTLSAQIGHPVAIFFGYTNCPDECPLALANLARALRSPGAPRGAAVAFITVDPVRDTPAVLKHYVGLFGTAFVGLTGSDAALAPVYAAYHTDHQRLPPEAGARGYAVAHSDTIFYIGRDGSLRAFGNAGDAPATMLRALGDASV